MNSLLTTYSFLPASAIVDELLQQLRSHSAVVVTAPPGAGKSTLLPLCLPGRVLVLEPRRIAARQVAQRMAEMLGESVGQTVGYRVRFDSCISAATRITVVTEGILTRMLIDDPTLEAYDTIVFDEFHERSLHTDVALALTRETQRQLRDDLRIVIMSATMDTDLICRTMQAPLVESAGRMFPVDIRRFETAAILPTAQEVAACIGEAYRAHEGDILVFLPGQGDIERVQEALLTMHPHYLVCPLYGALSMEEQRRAILPNPAGERKIVLSTNIAETSLTIEGVRVVIDSGLCRTLVYDPRNGLSHLETVRISQDMMTQRSGRAGRVAPGVCYRLYSLATEYRMPLCRKAEIEEADLCSMLLDIAAFTGSGSAAAVLSLPWMTAPTVGQLAAATEVLTGLAAMDVSGALTAHGRRLSSLPCHPRLAAMLLSATTDHDRAVACYTAALVETQGETRDTRRIADEYRRLLRVNGPRVTPAPYEIGRFIAEAYPERLMRSGTDWQAVAAMDARSGRIYLSAPVRQEDIEHLAYTVENIRWDSRQNMLVAETERRIGRVVMDTRPLRPSEQQLVALIAEAAPKYGLSMFDFSDTVENLQQRVATVALWHPELDLPDLSNDAVLARAGEWLPLYIGSARSAMELKKIDMAAVLWSLLSYDQQLAVDRIAPTHITVPTGSRIRVEYRLGAELPILRVRLQECFGMTDTPRVDADSRPVLMELLSPGFKPVQLTSDLRSFWSGTYFEVRKELRRRYPKHAWPDDPLTSPAVRGVPHKH